MVRISNISFFRFCWKNEKFDWPNCARTCFVSSRFCFPQFPYSVLFLCSIQYFVTFHLFSSVLKAGIIWKWRVDDLTQALVNCHEKISLCKILTKAISLHHFSLIKTLLMLYESGWSASILKKKKRQLSLALRCIKCISVWVDRYLFATLFSHF